MRLQRTLVAAIVGCTVAHSSGRALAPRFEQVYPLKLDEGVFAYARISPDGRLLAYASETGVRPNFVQRTVTVVELKDRRILFTEPGIDAYWSTDGQRMIFLSFRDARRVVSIRDSRSGQIERDIAPVNLGDYFSWGLRGGKDLILTINSRYYFLDSNRAVLPASSVQSCEGIGVGERPLLSKDGLRISTFVRGTVVVRNLTDCGGILDTGIRGAKADFSWDSRYVAFHAPKTNGSGYEIQIVDLQRRTLRTLTNLPGSSFFPSWTRDGRLCFRYDGDQFRGFMMADNVLAAPEGPLPDTDQHVPSNRTWLDLFPETRLPPHHLNVVTIWGAWSAHSPDALIDLQRARQYFDAHALDIGVMTAIDPGSLRSDVDALRRRYGITLPEIALDAERLPLTEAHNQVPTTLLFRDEVLIDRRLGAQSYDSLLEWIEERTR